MNTIEKIISYLFNEYFLKNFIERCYLKLIYDRKFKSFIKLIIDYYSRYNTIPNIDEFMIYSTTEAREDADEYKMWYQKYKSISPNEGYQFLIDELKKEYVNKGVTHIMENFDSTKPDLKDLTFKLGKLEEATDENSDTRQRFVHEQLDDRMARLDRALLTTSLKTDFSQFDNYTGGMNRKELYLFFGRTGIGKTRTLFNFAYNLVEQGGYWGMYFTFEMPLEQMERLFDSRLSGVSSDQFKHGLVDKVYYSDILNLIKVKKYPLFFVEHSGLATLSYIEGKIREFKKQFPLDFVVIDYIGLMTEPGNKDKHEKLGTIARGLKNIAKREDIVMITASQANRKVKETEKVGTENISGSDEIGANCDFIAYIQRGKLTNGMIDIEILKNREGMSNVIMKFLIDFPTNKMTDAIEFNNPDNTGKI